jgi:hypothetical protein
MRGCFPFLSFIFKNPTVTETEIDFDAIDSLELDDHLILLRQNSHRLQVLNPLASLVWQFKKDGLSSHQIAIEISQAFDMPVKVALQDVNSISAQWLLDLTTPPSEKPVEKQHQPLAEALTYRQPDISIFFAISCYTVKVTLDSQMIAHKIRAILSHLEIPETQQVSLQLDVISNSDTYLIVKDSDVLEQTETESDTALMVFSQIMTFTCKHDNWLILLHAAGVSWQGHGLVFPALGGSGKTTLTAALIKHGFDYINDDVIPLLRNSHELVSLPFSLSIKSGSWPLLQSLYPQLEGLEVFASQERSIKYLPPPPKSIQTHTYSAKHIILPVYQAGATASLEPLHTVSALQAIIEGESALHLPLNKADIKALISWLSGLTCHRLTYDELNPAVTLLSQFCKENYQESSGLP